MTRRGPSKKNAKPDTRQARSVRQTRSAGQAGSVRQTGSVRLLWDSKPVAPHASKGAGRQTGSGRQAGAGRQAGSVLATDEVVIPNPRARERSEAGDLPFPPPQADDKGPTNRLLWGDNLLAMGALLEEGLGKSVDLIYIDPPFASRSEYAHRITVKGIVFERRAYRDTWGGGLNKYLDMLFPRLGLMKRLLKDDGVIFVHCDWRANSYIRVLLDEVFGPERFLNEIVWHYGGRGAKAVSNQFPRNHDTIFAYGSGPGAALKKVYNEKVMTLDEAAREGFRTDDEGRIFKTAPRGDYTDESVRRLEKEGRIHRTSCGKVRIKYFLEKRGRKVVEKKLVGDVWDDIPDAMHSPPAERTAFGTQKPERLLRRIIESASEKGDLVCDFFSGSGTTGVAAGRLGRRWIMCEEEATGVRVSRGRLVIKTRTPFTIERVKVKRPPAPAPAPPAAPPTPHDAGGLSLSKPTVKKTAEGKLEVSIEISGYKPKGVDWAGGAGGRRFTKKSQEAAKEILEAAARDFSLLIDYWAVDWDYDGKLFKSRWQGVRGSGKIARPVETRARAVIERGGEDKGVVTIAVRLVDVFGNTAEKVLEAGK